MNSPAYPDSPPWCYPEQLQSREPVVIVDCVMRHGPGFDEDTEPRKVEVVLSIGAYNRLKHKSERR